MNFNFVSTFLKLKTDHRKAFNTKTIEPYVHSIFTIFIVVGVLVRDDMISSITFSFL